MNKIKTILYAEDDIIVLMAYQNFLQQAGYHVIPARDGLQAMKRLSIFVPDLIVLDLMMPRFNGEEVLQFVRANLYLSKVPVIVLSTNSVLDTAQEHLLQSSYKRLIKSRCNAATLLEAIKEALAAAPAETSCSTQDQLSAPFSPVLRAATA
jgi:CheY-like chemotaxis protein